MIKYKVNKTYDVEMLEDDLNRFTKQGWELWVPPFSHNSLDWDDDDKEMVLWPVLVAVLRGYDS